MRAMVEAQALERIEGRQDQMGGTRGLYGYETSSATGGSFPNFEPSPIANWPSEFVRAMFFPRRMLREAEKAEPGIVRRTVLSSQQTLSLLPQLVRMRAQSRGTPR